MNSLAYIVHRLKQNIRSGQEARAKIAAAMTTTAGHALMKIEWLKGSVSKIYSERLSTGILNSLEQTEDHPKDYLLAARERLLKDMLLFNPNNSTSAFANACKDQELEAKQELYRLLDEVLTGNWEE